MEFNYIVNPETGRRVSIHGKTGQKVLRNYLQAGGAMRSGSRIHLNNIVKMEELLEVVQEFLLNNIAKMEELLEVVQEFLLNNIAKKVVINVKNIEN